MCFIASVSLFILLPLPKIFETSLNAPTFPMETASSFFKIQQKNYLLDESFPEHPRYTRWLSLDFHCILYMAPVTCLEVYLFDFIY